MKVDRMPPVSFRPLKPGEVTKAVDFVLKVFTECVALQFSQEGIAEFKTFVCTDAMTERLKAGNILLVAESGQNIVGFIEIRENKHIALLFVEGAHQRKGIGKELIRRSISLCRQHKPDIRRVTVNSSPNAFISYQKFGFEGVEGEKVVNGIRFIPMEFIIEDNGGSPPANSTGPKHRNADSL